MGLLKDVISSAMGSSQINNGCSNSGLQLPFASNSNNTRAGLSSPSRQQLAPGQGNSHVTSQYDEGPVRFGSSLDQGLGMGGFSRREHPGNYSTSRCEGDYDDRFALQPPPYATYPGTELHFQQQQTYQRYYTDFQFPQTFPRNHGFRTLALPQIGYGDGQPFLRGYSYELERYNISMESFIGVIDRINVVIIPNPEQQLFQKGASIAGFFVPGAGGIGLMVGQIAVGVGGGIAKTNRLSTALAEANLNLFLPNGLEIGIGKTTNVDNEVGIFGGPQTSMVNMGPQERVACYGNRLAPLSDVLPPLPQSGRHDPIAVLGNAVANRDNAKKLNKAQRKMDRGRNDKMNNIEEHLKWIVVRRVTPQALEYWENNKQQSNATARV